MLLIQIFQKGFKKNKLSYPLPPPPPPMLDKQDYLQVAGDYYLLFMCAW